MRKPWRFAVILPGLCLSFLGVSWTGVVQAAEDDCGLPLIQAAQLGSDQPFDRFIEGDDARYFLEALLESSGDETPTTGHSDAAKKSKITDVLLHEVFPKLRRVRLKGTRKSLEVQALFDAPVDASFEKRADAQRFGLYGLQIPRFLRFRVTYQIPKILIERIEDPGQTLSLLLKIPVVSDRVYLHRIIFNPADGSLEAEAGVLGDHLRVFAKASTYEKKFEGIDYWKTILHAYRPLLASLWTLSWRRSSLPSLQAF